MLIAVIGSGGQFVTLASRLPGQFVAPGYRPVTIQRIIDFSLFWPGG